MLSCVLELVANPEQALMADIEQSNDDAEKRFLIAKSAVKVDLHPKSWTQQTNN